MTSVKRAVRGAGICLACQFTLITASGANCSRESYSSIDYSTVISDKDRHNSAGVRLKKPGAIVRQDRANYHKFLRRDTGDEPDVLRFAGQTGGFGILSKATRRGDLELAVDRFFAGKGFMPLGSGKDSLVPHLQKIIGDGDVRIVVTFHHCATPPHAFVYVQGLAAPETDHSPLPPRETDRPLLPPPPN